MTWRRSRAGGRGAWWAAAVGVALWLGACSRPVELVPGQAVEGELEPGTSASYRIDLESEAFARLRLVPQAVEGVTGVLAARVLAPDDRRIAEAASVREEAGGLLAWVGDRGTYGIEIENTGSGIPVAYRLEVELRAARAGDRERAAAENARAAADRLAEDGNRESAIAALDRAQRHWIRAGEHDSAAAVLLETAEFDYVADPEGAIARCNQVIELSAKAGVPARRVEALNLKGTILLLRNKDCVGALAAYEKGLEAARTTGEPRWEAEVQFSIAAAQRRCDPERGVAAFEEAIAAARRAGQTSLEAQSYRELAIMAKHRGDLATARDRIEHAWRLAQRSEDREVEADVAHELGNLYRRQGRLAEALESYRRCLDLNEELGRHALLPDVLLSLGVLALELRRPEEAWAFNLRSLEAAESLGDPERQADALVELGAVLHRQRDYIRAEEYFRRALAASEGMKAGAQRDRKVAAARFRLGYVLLAEDRLREAVDELTAALEVLDAVEDPIGEIHTRQVLGAALGRVGAVAPAKHQLSTALRLSEDLGDPLRTLWILLELARVEAAEEPRRARRTIEKAIAIGQGLRAGLSMDPHRAGFSEAPRRLYELYIDLLAAAGDAEAAFAASEEGHARALLDLLAEARIDLATGVASSLREELQSIDERIAWLRHRLGDAAASADDGQTAVLRSEIARAEREWWRVEAAMREQSARYQEVRDPVIADVAAVQRGLTAGRALVEYWLGEEHAFVFVLTRTTFRLIPLPASRAIEEDVVALRSAALALRPPEAYALPAFRLYRDLVAPALEAAGTAAERIEELVIVPDGSLHLLPFEALVTTTPRPGARFEDLAFLIREVSISYAPSASVLTNLEKGRLAAADDAAAGAPPGPKIFAYADPSYTQMLPFDCPEGGDGSEAVGSRDGPLRSRRLEALAGSRSEGRAIEDRYGRRARVYYGPEASEERVKTDPDLAAAERVHFAVHGLVCESLPERSALVFALDGGAEDGILEIREIFALELSADLVVLSACDTGLGRVVSGEGVVGMARAFFYAGAPTLVVSLWQVSDRSTERLMTAFYDQLDRGVDKAEALRRARLALLEGGGPHAAPFHWAPFVLLGSRGEGSSEASVTMSEP